MDQLNRTHKIYGYVTEDEFYAGLNEAKKENLFVDEKGWVDIGELLHEMWVAFADGRMAIVPKEGFKQHETKIESPALIEADNKDVLSIDEFSIAAVHIETPKKRPLRSKKAKEPIEEMPE